MSTLGEKIKNVFFSKNKKNHNIISELHIINS